MRLRRLSGQSYLQGPAGRQRRAGWRWLALALLTLSLLAALALRERAALPGLITAALGRPATPTPFASDYANRGMQALASGDEAAAIANLQQAVSLQPQQADYRYELGRLYLARGDYPAAAAQARAILQGDERDIRGHTLEVARLAFSGEPQQAIVVGRSALEINDAFAPLLAALSRAYLNASRIEEGVAFAERALVADSNDADVRRAYAFALLFLQDREGAIAHLREAARLAPHVAAVYLELAGVLLADDQNQAAVEVYETLLARQPKHARANLRLCQAYIKMGRFEQALGYCEDATAHDPLSSAAWLQLGELRYNRRDFAGAAAALAACADSGGEALACWWMRALALYYLGDCAAAWPLWREARALALLRGAQTALGYLDEGARLMRADEQCAAAEFGLGG